MFVDSAASTATPSAFLSDASFTSHLPDIPINKQDDATHTYIILDERMSGAVPLDASVMEANETVVSVNKSQMVAQPGTVVIFFDEYYYYYYCFQYCYSYFRYHYANTFWSLIMFHLSILSC